MERRRADAAAERDVRSGREGAEADGAAAHRVPADLHGHGRRAPTTWSVIHCAYFASFGPVRTSETDVTAGSVSVPASVVRVGVQLPAA